MPQPDAMCSGCFAQIYSHFFTKRIEDDCDDDESYDESSSGLSDVSPTVPEDHVPLKAKKPVQKKNSNTSSVLTLKEINTIVAVWKEEFSVASQSNMALPPLSKATLPSSQTTAVTLLTMQPLRHDEQLGSCSKVNASYRISGDFFTICEPSDRQTAPLVSIRTTCLQEICPLKEHIHQLEHGVLNTMEQERGVYMGYTAENSMRLWIAFLLHVDVDKEQVMNELMMLRGEP